MVYKVCSYVKKSFLRKGRHFTSNLTPRTCQGICKLQESLKSLLLLMTIPRCLISPKHCSHSHGTLDEEVYRS